MDKDSDDRKEQPSGGDALKALEDAIRDSGGKKFVLRLYVTGTTPNSLRAIKNIRKLCQENLKECELEIIDIYQQPIFAKNGQIVAAPTLVKELPPPLRKFIGDMSNAQKILLGLDLRTREDREKDEDRNDGDE